MGGLETLLPTGGIGATLVAVIIYLLRANIQDRKDYREAVEAWESQFDDAVTRYRDLQVRLDGERELRRKAEDESARATRAVERATAELERATLEIAGLRQDVKALRAQVSEMNGS